MKPGKLTEAVRQLHENVRLIAWAVTPLGRLLVWLSATLLLPRDVAFLVSPLLILVLFAPEYRNLILSLGSVWVLYQMLSWSSGMSLIPLAGGILLGGGLLYLCFLAAKSYRRLPMFVQRNPQVSLHLLMWVGLALAWILPETFNTKQSGLWPTVVALRWILPFLVWRSGYLLMAGRRGTALKSGFLDHLFYCLPSFGGSNVPFGKGHDYLSQARADSPEALSKAQLAGLKLLILAWLWKGVRVFIDAGVYGKGGNILVELFGGRSLGITQLGNLIASQPDDASGLVMAWSSLFVELIDFTLDLAIWGHVIVGCLRLFGYNVFRNTYKPLLAESLVDFWNRFYYYFKELLAQFFFFPMYLSYFKSWPKLRIFAAIMAAALFGNVYYHVLRDLEDFLEVGLQGAWSVLAPRLFYSFLLATGIFVSMVRQQKQRGKAAEEETPGLAIWRRIRRVGGVWLFYGIIHIWNVWLSIPSLTFAKRTSFFLSLFGL